MKRQTIFYRNGIPTQCSKGHPLNSETSYRVASGQIICRLCAHDYYMKTRERQLQRHKDKIIAINKDPVAKKNRKERHARTWLKHAYGLTPERKQEMFIEQDGLCTICNRPMESCEKARVDHNHYTEAVRGLVHDMCNKKLGVIECLFHDDPETLERMLHISKET